jgi:molybdate transport system substrate-binding protein
MKPMTRRGILAGGAGFATCHAIAPAQATGRVLVAAASDLQLVFPKLADAFAHAAGLTATVSFSSTGNIARQIRQGAPFEVFLAADESFIDSLARDGVIAARGAAYARGQLSVVVSRRHALSATPTLAAVAAAAASDRSFRVAIANPEIAPYGQRALEAMVSQGVADALKPRLVYGETVAQALQFVATGAAVAGLVGSSLTTAPQIADALVASTVPQAWHSPLIQRLAVTRKGGENAHRFAEFMTGNAAKSILTASGFLMP